MTFRYSQYPSRIAVAFSVAIALLVNLHPVDGAERGGASTGLIPIDDLGSGQYLNVLRGGLYGDGINGSLTATRSPA